MNTAPSSQKHQPAFSQNINSFLSNFNYNATSPLNLVQSSDVEESPNQGIPSSREGVANSDHARPIKVEPPNNFELGETELKNRSEYQAGLASRLGTFPGWTMKGKGLDSPRGVHFVSKSKALEHVMANGGLQEEVLVSIIWATIRFKIFVHSDDMTSPINLPTCVPDEIFSNVNIEIK